MIKDFPLPMYYSHNLAFGLAGAMMSGDAELALRYAEHATKAYPETGDARRFDPTPRTYVALARYAPDKMLALPVSPRDDDEYRVYHAYARGEALLQKGDAAGARVEVSKLRKAAGDDAEGKIALAVLEGRLAMTEGNIGAALDRFNAGAKLQDDEFGGWMDPPTWWYPVRRSLAAAYLKAGDFAKAEAEASSVAQGMEARSACALGAGQGAAGAGPHRAGRCIARRIEKNLARGLQQHLRRGHLSLGDSQVSARNTVASNALFDAKNKIYSA